MTYRPDARHAQRRLRPGARVLIWRAIGGGIGLVIGAGMCLAALAIWGGPS